MTGTKTMKIGEEDLDKTLLEDITAHVR